MAWMIECTDGPDGPRLRTDKSVMAAHWAYELSIRSCILAAGSLRKDDGITPVGSLLIVDVPTRADALALVNDDPATQAGLRGTIRVTYWNQAILAGREID